MSGCSGWRKFVEQGLSLQKLLAQRSATAIEPVTVRVDVVIVRLESAWHLKASCRKEPLASNLEEAAPLCDLFPLEY